MSPEIYHFYYPDFNVHQEKVLISHEAWLRAMLYPHAQQKTALNYFTGGREWFTDKSPLFDAIKTGVLVCNGNHKAIITKINESHVLI